MKLPPPLLPAWWNGRHKRLKIARRKPCQFESDSGHHGFSAVLTSIFLLVAGVLLCGPAPARAEPALWVLRDDDSTVYLFGTIHILPKDLAWQDERIRAAFEASDELWLETNVSGGFAMILPMLRYATNYGEPLERRLGPEDGARLRETAIRLGLSMPTVNHLRPWLVSIMIEMAGATGAGEIEAGAGADMVLERAARGAKKDIRFLESLSEQFRMFADMDEESELDLLRAALDNEGPSMTDTLPGMVDAWMAGDPDRLFALFIGDEQMGLDDALYDRMIRQRNAHWVAQIETMMAGAGHQFIAVGAGHLAGPDSVLTLLAARGFHAERIEGGTP